MEIIPAILAKSFQDFDQKIKSPLMDIVPWVHIDVMDGTFTQKSCVSHPALIPNNFHPAIELHLMVNDPLPYLEEWVSHKNFKRAILHIESPSDHARSALFARAHEKEIGFAISPNTPTEKLDPILAETHHCLIMGVNPGASGQAFLGDPIFERLRILQQKAPHHEFALDGGVNAKLIPLLKKAGFVSACTSSAIWDSSEAITAYKRLTYL